MIVESYSPARWSETDQVSRWNGDSVIKAVLAVLGIVAGAVAMATVLILWFLCII